LSTSVACLWIKFTFGTNWIASIFSIITSITVHSKQCWNSWIKLFFTM
jgi:hypothetical protein